MTHPVQFVFRPRFALDQVAPFRDDAVMHASEAAVARWSELLPGHKNRPVDHEDFHENAALLIAAVATGLPVFVMEPATGGDAASWTRVARAFNTDAPEPERGVATLLIGWLLQKDPLAASLDIQWPLPSALRAAERHHDNPAFPALAGRAVALAVHTDEGDPGHGGDDGLMQTVARMAREVGPDLVVKIVNRAKFAKVERINVPDPDDAEAIGDALRQAFEYSLVHVDGQVPRFLVQERIGLEAEYRVVVVDLEPVAGAACIESMSPPWNGGARFDTKVEGIRGGGEVREDPALVARYVEAARAAAFALHDADTEFRDATLDLGLKPDGGIALIEANPLGNFGLYALDCNAFVMAAVGTVRKRQAVVETAPRPAR